MQRITQLKRKITTYHKNVKECYKAGGSGLISPLINDRRRNGVSCEKYFLN